MAQTGYTRQSAGSIVTGATILAAHFNNEYNQLASAFDNTTGHRHDGSVTGSGASLVIASFTGLTNTSSGILGADGANGFTTRTITGTSGTITVTNGSGVSGNPTLTIDAAYIGQSTITTLGTIGTGVWHGTIITGTFGGTGVNNGSSTITVGANVTFSGAFTTTLTVTGATSLTLPATTDTLVGRATTDTLTNKTLTSPVISTISNTGTLTLPTSTDTLIGKATTDTLTNKTFDTAGTGNVFKVNGTSLTAVTGSGSVVLATTPTLVTPVLGVASATSINKVAITAPTSSATLTIADGKTLTANNTLTFTGTDTSSVAFGTGGTVVYTTITSLGSLTSASTLATVGTITSGTWNSTKIGQAYGGTNLDSSASTGIAQVSSGTWSISTALASGTTATTQSLADNSTKVATTAYVDRIAVTSNVFTNSIVGDVTLTTQNTYYDGPTVAQGSTGTWFASGTVTIIAVNNDTFNIKLWDGTTVIASASTENAGSSLPIAVSLSGYLASPAGNIRISVSNASINGGTIKANLSGNSKDSTISVFRIA